MTDDAVWAEGLLTFYEIFKFLEEAMDRLSHTLIGELDIKGMRRTKAFEEDLQFYYGKEWLENEYQPNNEVTAFLEYLRTLESEDPHRLAAYIDYFYFGFFTGGQLLRRKRSLEASLRLRKGNESGNGESVTDLFDISIHKLKKQMMEATEHIAESVGEEDRRKLIEESKHVFRMNNKIIRAVKGIDRVILRKLMNFTLIALPIMLVVYFGSRMLSH